MTEWIRRLRGAPAHAGWQRIARVCVAVAGASQVSIGPGQVFQNIKLRSRGAEIEVYRWMLEFDDGTFVDLFVNSLVEGSESASMPIASKRLKSVVVKFAARSVTRRGRLEIWAQQSHTPPT